MSSNYSQEMDTRNSLLGKKMPIFFKEPVKIVKGALQYLYDDKG